MPFFLNVFIKAGFNLFYRTILVDKQFIYVEQECLEIRRRITRIDKLQYCEQSKQTLDHWTHLILREFFDIETTQIRYKEQF